MGPFEVDGKSIEGLDQFQLVGLLKKLLHLEARACGIPLSAAQVPLDINVPDGGEDGRIRWQGGVEKTENLPKRFTIFQVKATEMGAAKCYEEMMKEGSVALKDQIVEVLDGAGVYIIFCKQTCNEILLTKRLKKMREALKDAGRGDWDTACVEFYDGDRIATWVNAHAAAQIYVLICLRRNVPFGLHTWEGWSRHADFENNYVWNDKLKEHVEYIRRYLASHDKPTMRVTGLSGLGKTRLVLEAFRGDGPAVAAGRENVVYFDASGGDGGMVTFVEDSRHGDISMTLVVDNCDPELHERLVKASGYSHCKFGLLTLDYDSAKVACDKTALIQITEKDCDGVVKGIVKARYPGLDDQTVNRIEEFSQGFARIAVLLAKQVADGVRTIGLLSDDGLVKRLLWGRDKQDGDVVQVITVCSLFDYVEFSEKGFTDEMKFLAEIAGVAEKTFNDTCRKYLRLGILQRRGRFVRVCPIPLAIRLAAEWWDGVPDNEIMVFFNTLGNEGLAERFCEQARKLSFSSKASALVERLCGPQGPFGNPEVLLSDEGSSLFRSLVEVNPQATSEVLQSIIGCRSHEELLAIGGDTRRNLVWALEKLCWWEDIFGTAARLLLRLAAAENEQWANNATGQFMQLFQVRLSGTKANLNKRIGVVREALQSSVAEEREVGLRALGHAIRQTDFFSRGGGVERQGSRVPEHDYNPTGKEVYEYWGECISVLTSLIAERGEYAASARRELGSHVGGLIRHGMLNEVEEAVRTVAAQNEPVWIECLASLRRLLDHDNARMPDDIRERVTKLESVLLPQSLKDRLRMTVSVPDWRNRKDENGHYASVSAEEAEKLARELAGDRSWFDIAPILLTGEQRQAYAFGRELGRSMTAGLRRDFITVCLNVLREPGPERGNADVLAAFLGTMPDGALVDETMETVIGDERLWGYSVAITRFLPATEKSLERLFPLLEQKKIGVGELKVLSFGASMDNLPDGFVSEFCGRIADFSREGANCALDILSTYCYQNDERFVKCAATFRGVIMRSGLLIGEEGFQMEGYNWEVVSKRLLAMSSDTQLAKHLAEDIVRMCGSDDVPYNHIHDNAKSVMATLISEYFDACWEIIGKGLVGKDWRTTHELEDILGLGYEKDKGKALIEDIPQEGLLAWCKENIPRGPAAIAGLVPLFSGDKDRVTLHPLACMLIDNWGHLDEVRSKLESNLLSFMSAGSRAPYYERRIALLRGLADHPTKEVREWAVSAAKWLEKDRDEAQREAEEWEWGITRHNKRPRSQGE